MTRVLVTFAHVVLTEEEFSGAEIGRCAAVQYLRDEEQGEARSDSMEVLATDTQAEAVSQLTLNFMENVEEHQQPTSREEIVALQVNEGTCHSHI